MENNQLYTFWELLKEHEVFVPVIQRDYAQGRKGKETLRKKFFNGLIDALHDPTNHFLKLDFVYGAIENGKFMPLDGQQRLTSLWLLHWYLAYMTGHLNEPNVHDILGRFSYETRITSREFIQKLCHVEMIDCYENHERTISDIISDQPWFTNDFASDPTVKSMLLALSDKDGNAGFEQLLSSIGSEELESYWNLCISNCPIQFYYKDLKDDNLPQSDNLYVKMNARGKKLTNFENFKAELFRITKKDNPDEFLFSQKSFISPFENRWTNLIFWPYHTQGEEKKIDDIFFKFINRCFRNWILRKLTYGEAKNNELWKQLEKENLLGAQYEFEGIKAYQDILYSDSDFVERFTQLMNHIASFLNVYRHENGISSFKFNDILYGQPYFFKFIPEYEDNSSKVSEITSPWRAMFEGICCYFINNKSFDEKAFSDWMYFVRNIVYNSNNSQENLHSLLGIIYGLGKHSKDIIEYLANLSVTDINITSDKIRVQYEEEIEKAKVLYAIRSSKDFWGITENDIRFAESELLTDGAIRFLFEDSEGNVDWKNFKLKLENAKKLFGTHNSHIPTEALRNLVSHFKLVEQFSCDWKLIYNSSKESWKNILLDFDILKEPVHSLLLSNPMNKEQLAEFLPHKDSFNALNDKIRFQQLQQELVCTSFLGETKWESFAFRINNMLFTPYNSKADWKKYYLGTPRNRLLTQALNESKIVMREQEQRSLNESGFFWGADLDFQYREHLFRWYRTKWTREPHEVDVYMMQNSSDDKLDYIKRKISNGKIPKNDEESYYAIKVEDSISQEDFYKKLNWLISESKN